MIGAGMLKKAPIIGENFFTNPLIRAAHPWIPSKTLDNFLLI